MASGKFGSFAYIFRRWAYSYKYVLNIELQTPVLSQPKSYHAIELLKWCWVIQVEIFVLIYESTKLQLKIGLFGYVHCRPDGFPETGSRGGSN